MTTCCAEEANERRRLTFEPLPEGRPSIFRAISAASESLQIGSISRRLN